LPLPTVRAYVALGSNLGDRLSYLRIGLAELGDLIVARSRVYETDPVGGPEAQGAYLNMVVEVVTNLDPYALLRRCRTAEAKAGRIRKERNGPRTLDCDVLWYEGATVASDALTVPHPRMWERRFVLQPLADVAPELVPNDWETRVQPGGVYPTDLRP
jgi:2-amino-4-hydroxy-6-hydroxymethyldihydropteridine diphosphokinase